jgi:hypothetical protein
MHRQLHRRRPFAAAPGSCTPPVTMNARSGMPTIVSTAAGVVA